MSEYTNFLSYSFFGLHKKMLKFHKPFIVSFFMPFGYDHVVGKLEIKEEKPDHLAKFGSTK